MKRPLYFVREQGTDFASVYHTGSPPSSISQRAAKTLNPNQIKSPKFSSIQSCIEMKALKFKPFSSIISPSHLTPPFFLYLRLFSSPSSSSLARTAEDANFTLTLFNYLINTFKFSQTQAHTVSTRFSYVKSLERPQSVCDYLRNVGFSDTQVIESVRHRPQILFSDVDRTLKPKIQYFQDLGLVGPDLCKFISQNSSLLSVSLEKKLVPVVENLKRVFLNDKNNKNNENLFKALRRCNWIVKMPDRFLSRIAFFESCGIVGSQLSLLLRWQPRLFATGEPVLRDLVSRTLKMGISVDSRMFVHALYTVSCLSVETLEKKCEIFESFGFSRDETIEMFRRAPYVFKCSEEKLKLGLEFFLSTVKIDKEQLVHNPAVLMYSIEDRAIPRYRVLEVMKSKRLLKKEPRFISVMPLGEEKFLERYILSYTDYAEELLVAYKSYLSAKKCSLS